MHAPKGAKRQFTTNVNTEQNSMQSPQRAQTERQSRGTHAAKTLPEKITQSSSMHDALANIITKTGRSAFAQK